MQAEFTLSTDIEHTTILASIQELEELSSSFTLKSKQKGGNAADDIANKNKATSPFRDKVFSSQKNLHSTRHIESSDTCM